MKLRSLALVLASTAAAVTTCSVAPASADVPATVTSGRHGSVDAGWVRAACAVNTDAAKCAIRFPEGVRRLEVEYRHGGTRLGTEVSWDRDVAPRARQQVRRMDRQVAPGVRLKCMSVGAIVDCTIDLDARYTDFNVTSYSGGWMLGGLKGEGVGVVDPQTDVQEDVVVEDEVVGGEVIDLAPYEEIPTVVVIYQPPVVDWTPAPQPVVPEP